MDESPALKRKLDPLYAGPPEEFIAGRDALAKELKADGDADAAKAVKKLRRPSVAAALVNRVALGHPGETKAYAKAVAELRKASGRSLRDAAKAERAAAAELHDLAEAEGGEGATLDRFAETLQAAAADEEIEDLVVRGRLEKEQRGASIGFGLLVSDDDEPAAKPLKAEKKAAKGKESEAAEEAPGDEPKQSAAERKREKAAEKRLEQARKREQRKVDKAKKALEAAVTEQQGADDEVEAAEEALAEAKQDLADAKDAASEAAEAVTEAKQELRERERELADLD